MSQAWFCLHNIHCFILFQCAARFTERRSSMRIITHLTQFYLILHVHVSSYSYILTNIPANHEWTEPCPSPTPPVGLSIVWGETDWTLGVNVLGHGLNTRCGVMQLTIFSLVLSLLIIMPRVQYCAVFTVWSRPQYITLRNTITNPALMYPNPWIWMKCHSFVKRKRI